MIVMKFGGTSVQDAEAIDRVCNIVKSRVSKKPVVVLSAISKATDILIQSAELAAGGKLREAKDKISKLKDRHIKISSELLKDENSLRKLKEKLTEHFSDINDLLKGISLLSELSPKIQARVVSYGELLSTLIASYAMKEKGVNSVLLDSRDFIITDSNYLKGEPQIDEITVRAQVNIPEHLKKGFVPVIQGFISRTKHGAQSVLGRGGSDYTASLAGMALNAKAIEIWTDVDGILTADPNKVEGTKIISKISFEEAAELAYFGAKILHPLTIQPAVEKNIPVWIKNSHSPEAEGTLILNAAGENENEVKSIACKENVIVINIFSMRMLNSYGFLKKIFEVFDKHKTSVDLITTSEVNVSVTLDNDEYLEEIKSELSEFAKVNVETDKSLVCIVGSNIRNTKGISGKIFGVLTDYNITMISQGSSLINVSFVVDKGNLNDVLQKLHNTFFKD
jgi:aspartate kinase